MLANVTELTNALSPGQNEDLLARLPTGDDLRFGEVDLGDPPVGQETMEPSFVPLFYPLAPWSIRCKTHPLDCHPDPVSEPVRGDSDVAVDESSVAPGSMQTSPRDLTRSQGELVRSSLENADPATVRRRIVGKRTIIPPVPSASSANVDSVRVPDSLPEAGMPKALEPSAGDTKKRRVESFDESMDWFQRERSSIAWLTNSSDERKVFEIDVGDQSFWRDCQMGNRLRLPITVSCQVNSYNLMMQ